MTHSNALDTVCGHQHCLWGCRVTAAPEQLRNCRFLGGKSHPACSEKLLYLSLIF